MGRIKITSRGKYSGFGIGINWDFEYKDLVINILKWYIAIGIKRGIKDRKSTRLNSSHIPLSRMPSSA